MLKCTTRLAALTAVCLTLVAHPSNAQDPLSAEQQEAAQTLIAEIRGHVVTCLENEVTDGVGTDTSVCESAVTKLNASFDAANTVESYMWLLMGTAVVRDRLTDLYLQNTNLPKHCEQQERNWALRDMALQYKGHPLQLEIVNITNPRVPGIRACRMMGGKPEWSPELPPE